MKNEELAEDHSSFRPEGTILHSSFFKGVPFVNIIQRWFALTGGEPVEGERNVRLSRLAFELRYLTDNNPQWLLQILPDYGLPRAEMESIVRSACSLPLLPSLPRTLREVLCPAVVGDEPPAMPEKLPRLVELLLSRTPEIYQPDVAHAIFPALGAHLCGVTFRYIDNTDHEATSMNVLMAPTGAGKSCINPVIDRIMADIRARDDENLKRERQWKKEVNTRSANQQKPERPQ